MREGVVLSVSLFQNMSQPRLPRETQVSHLIEPKYILYPTHLMQAKGYSYHTGLHTTTYVCKSNERNVNRKS